MCALTLSTLFLMMQHVCNCRYNLRLERNEHLIRPGNKVRVWFADSPDDAATVDSTTTSRSSSRNSSFAYGGIRLEELTQVRNR
jgi:hypothetical protein